MVKRPHRSLFKKDTFPVQFQQDIFMGTLPVKISCRNFTGNDFSFKDFLVELFYQLFYTNVCFADFWNFRISFSILFWLPRYYWKFIVPFTDFFLYRLFLLTFDSSLIAPFPWYSEYHIDIENYSVYFLQAFNLYRLCYPDLSFNHLRKSINISFTILF